MIVSLVVCTLISTLISALLIQQYNNKHYFPMQRYEVTCLTNAVYKLSGQNANDCQRENLVYQIMGQRGNSKYESNVVDVLESHPELYGTWGEDDVQKPEKVNQEPYEKAQMAVERIIVRKRIPIIG